MKVEIPPEEYYKSLARVPTSGGAIIRNSKGEFLMVKQTYKDGWHIAGGMSNLDETPAQAVIRETKEELGIDIINPRLFCVDFAVGKPFNRILFLFDCGIISDEQVEMIRLEQDEISGYRFVSKEKFITELSPKIQKRFKDSLQAFENGTCVYLETVR